jgi:hypothetical protein
MAFITAALVGGGASLLGGLLSSRGATSAAQTQSDAATEAAKIQAASADKSLALQERMYNEQVARNQPYVNAGSAAQNRLMSMLGLQSNPQYSGTQSTNALAPSAGASTSTSMPQPTVQTRDQLRQQLVAQYTTPATPGYTTQGVGMDSIGAQQVPEIPASVNEAALNAEIDRLYGQQQQAQQQWQASQGGGGAQAGTTAGEDPYYGMYANGYQAAPDLMVGNYQSPGNYQDPGDFSMEKFQQDPGYAFRMSEGLKALDRTAAARGGLISGGAMKAASRYGQDMASQEYQNAFNRYNQNRDFNSNLFNTNRTFGANQFNTDRTYQTNQYNQNRNFNTDLYQTNRTNALAPLGSLMASGQNAANNMSSAGQNYGNNAGSTYQQAGNAAAAGVNSAGQSAAAGQMAQSNAYGSALTTAASAYNQANALRNSLQNSNPAVAPYGTLDGTYDYTPTANRIGMY